MFVSEQRSQTGRCAALMSPAAAAPRLLPYFAPHNTLSGFAAGTDVADSGRENQSVVSRVRWATGAVK